MRYFLLIIAIAIAIFVFTKYKPQTESGDIEEVGTTEIDIPTEATKDHLISGKVSLDKSVEDKVSRHATLFIIAKAQEQSPPIAVKRVVNPKFPVSFTIGPDNVMMPGAALGEGMTVIARLSRTGNAMAAPGDLEGRFSKKVGPGNHKVNIKINILR